MTSDRTFRWDECTRYRVPLPNPNEIRHADIVPIVNELQAIRPESMQLRTLGQSAEGREILAATIGNGPRKVLAWSQMHGDEPTHTAVLVDLLNFLQTDPDHAAAAAILSGCTLQAIVMLNPDGAERGARQNAQGIDVNRDAQALASPASRLLHAAVEEFQPDFAFNLHNHNPRTMVGETDQVAAVALLAPPIDPEATDASHVLVAKQVASCFCRAVEPHASGMIARYRADFMPGAFGEWVQQQGTATVLVEAGGWPGPDKGPLRQLHFFGLVSALRDIATDEFRLVDRSIYESLPLTRPPT